MVVNGVVFGLLCACGPHIYMRRTLFLTFNIGRDQFCCPYSLTEI